MAHHTNNATCHPPTRLQYNPRQCPAPVPYLGRVVLDVPHPLGPRTDDTCQQFLVLVRLRLGLEQHHQDFPNAVRLKVVLISADERRIDENLDEGVANFDIG